MSTVTQDTLSNDTKMLIETDTKTFSDTKFSETETETFFSNTEFSETETLKKLAKVSKPRSFETEVSISA